MGYFTSKPVAKIKVIFDQDAQPEGNAVADHIEEHLLARGYAAEVSTEYVENVPLYVEQEGHDPRISATVIRVLDFAAKEQVEDVFDMGNPENAAYSDYCSWTSVKQAREDTIERELAFFVTS